MNKKKKNKNKAKGRTFILTAKKNLKWTKTKLNWMDKKKRSKNCEEKVICFYLS